MLQFNPRCFPFGVQAVQRLARLFAFLLFAVAPTMAIAGEVKFGQGPASLAVDDAGALTAEGKKAVVDAVDRTPGEDLWETQLWARVDRGAEGPVYVEFYQKVEGKEYIVQRYEEAVYDGNKYFTMDLELDGAVGFNKGRTYRVVVLQVDDKGKDVTLAKGTLKLIDTGRKPEPEEQSEAEAAAEESEAAQDELDGLGADDTDAEASPAPVEPPPVAPSSKGCTVAHSDGAPVPMLLAIVGLAGWARRSRRARRNATVA
ncbi:MAG: hypothetical protein B7733_12825 [Myxococcales bacterium FL481]|nr:MAG: hypothetical protein B7733_12825 [Myxococcales bacterium FL481]